MLFGYKHEKYSILFCLLLMNDDNIKINPCVKNVTQNPTYRYVVLISVLKY